MIPSPEIHSERSGHLGGRRDRRELWWEFHHDNPGVYALFKRYALEMISKGVRKSSPWLIVNRIRWEVALKTVGSEYKIPNEHIAYYSRLFMFEHPQYGKFFNTKTIKGEDDTWWQGALVQDVHDCVEHAVYRSGDGVLGDYYECGKCGEFVQAG